MSEVASSAAQSSTTKADEAVKSQSENEILGSVDFTQYLDTIEGTLNLPTDKAKALATDLNHVGAHMNDEAIIKQVAQIHKIDRERMRLALRIIEARAKAKLQREADANSPEAATEQPKVLSETEKLNLMINDLRGKLSDKDAEMLGLKNKLNNSENQMARLEPKIIRMELATNPLRIRKYLSMKMRDRMIERKARDPYSLLYYMKGGQMRRFVSTKSRLKNAPALLQKMQAKYTNIIENPKTPLYKQIEMKKRLAVLNQIAPTIQGVAPVKIKF